MPPSSLNPVPSLVGTYTAPEVKVGDRVWCRYRRCWCRVISWTDAPISWPRAARVGVPGGPGLWVNAELARAVRTESAAAMMHWFGVCHNPVWRWRRAFIPGNRQVRTEGDRIVHRRNSEKGAAVTRGVPLSDEVCKARSAAAKAAGRRPPLRGVWSDWTPKELAKLGTAPDDVVAIRIGRTVSAVRARRARLGIPPHRSPAAV